MTNLKNKLTLIDLFAGCGGLSLGLEKAGFFPLYVNELNDDARETYLINREIEYPLLREKYYSSDIKEILREEEYFEWLLDSFKEDYNRDFRKDEVDLVVGGPPCQGFSGIGIRRSYSVEKEQLPSNHLYQDMSYFIHSLPPHVYVAHWRWALEDRSAVILAIMARILREGLQNIGWVDRVDNEDWVAENLGEVTPKDPDFQAERYWRHITRLQSEAAIQAVQVQAAHNDATQGNTPANVRGAPRAPSPRLIPRSSSDPPPRRYKPCKSRRRTTTPRRATHPPTCAAPPGPPPLG